MTSEELRDTASRVLWLAGRPDDGKSTIARILARRHGLQLYSLDKHG